MLAKIEAEEEGTTEDEMIGWHHRLKAHEFEQALGVGDEQGSLVCCSLWGCPVVLPGVATAAGNAPGARQGRG